MVKQKPLFLCLWLLCTFIPTVVPCVKAAISQSLWTLIVCGSTGGSFSNNTQYMYHVLNEHYGLEGTHLYYLDVYTDRPGVFENATKDNVRSMITEILDYWSYENDIVFIYFTSHGCGYHKDSGFGPFIFHTTYYTMGDHGRISFETNDENQGREVREDNFKLTGCPRLSDPQQILYGMILTKMATQMISTGTTTKMKESRC